MYAWPRLSCGPKQDAIGKRLRLNDNKGPWVEVVGLTKPASYVFSAERPTEFLYTINANQPVYNVRTVSRFYEQRTISVAMRIMQLVATMGLLGWSLALVGLCGLIAYSVSRRTQEIGIRMAIGANPREVLGMVMRQGFTLVLIGVVVDGVLSFAVARLLTIGLVGLGQPNPVTYVVAPVALLLITMAACYIPARRASLIDPIRALRYE